MITYDNRLLRWQDLHIFVLCWSGVHAFCVLLCTLAAKVQKQTTQKDNKETTKSNKIQKFRVWMSQQKPRCLVFLSCFFAVVFPSCSAFLCCRLFASVPHGGCGRTARLAAPAQHLTLCTRTYQRARCEIVEGGARAKSINSKLKLPFLLFY